MKNVKNEIVEANRKWRTCRPATTLKPSNPRDFLRNSTPRFFKSNPTPVIITKSDRNFRNVFLRRNGGLRRNTFFSQCTNLSAPTSFVSETDADYDSEEETAGAGTGQTPPPVMRPRRRYRKAYPGEKNGIPEEMRFEAMKLRNSGKPRRKKGSAVHSVENEDKDKEKIDGGDGDTWHPTMEGFLKYLVDSELVFRTVEGIVDESTGVSYVYFRKTGLERSDCISKDLEWLREQGNVIPEASNPGVAYVQYLKELAEDSPPRFLSHFYNIYFSHISGGQVIAKQVSDKLLEGRELEFYKWEGDAPELFRGVREKLNALGEHWSRDEKNKCLREATKAFRFLGQIVRLVIL